jgi:hypothetical protein
MAAKVFISYRWADSAGYAGRVMDRLDRELGRDLVFMDVDALPLGTNFPKVLHEEVAKCSVLLAVIGPNWLDARDEHGSMETVAWITRTTSCASKSRRRFNAASP